MPVDGDVNANAEDSSINNREVVAAVAREAIAIDMIFMVACVCVCVCVCVCLLFLVLFLVVLLL